ARGPEEGRVRAHAVARRAPRPLRGARGARGLGGPARGATREPRGVEGFEARFRELRARGSRATATEVRPLGEELHQYLLKRAENAKLVDVLEHMREQVRPVWTMAIVAPRRVQALVREHLAIIDALKRRDVRRDAAPMALHVRRVRDAIFRLVD